MVVIMKAVFQAVNTSVCRPKSLSKGRTLLESFHVSEVQEEIDENNNRQIIGYVLRETTGKNTNIDLFAILKFAL